MFKEVDTRVDFPKLEHRILEFWSKTEAFKKIVLEQRPFQNPRELYRLSRTTSPSFFIQRNFLGQSVSLRIFSIKLIFRTSQLIEGELKMRGGRQIQG